jgi:YidC/Oxa1 family membrane protein insertase
MRPGPSGADNRNLLLAMVLAMGILFGYDALVLKPMRDAQRREIALRQEQAAKAAPGLTDPGETARPSGPLAPVPREELVAASARIPLSSANLDGTISLIGARIDDVALRAYRTQLAPDSPEVTLLSPRGAAFAADAFFGWEEREIIESLAGASTPWQALDAGPLTPTTPIRLVTEARGALRIIRTISMDEDFLFTLADRVENLGDGPRFVRPFAVTRRQGLPENYKLNGIVHQGMTGVFGAKPVLHETKFEAAKKHAKEKARGARQGESRIIELDGKGGWMGLTDHYWLTALIPDQNETLTTYYDANPDGGRDDFRATYRGSFREIAPGEAILYSQRLFVGAKRAEILKRYETDLAIPQFDKAIDWGNFWFFTRPVYSLIHWFFKLFGNFGLAIMAVTVVVKLCLFPLVNHTYKAMGKMRLLAPKMKEIQERFASDKARQQQETIALYQREKINPMAGCLPMLVPIPIFFALYKVLTVTIELRHQPFFGWIKDLSAPDPTSWVNLFGLLPFAAPTHLPVIGLVFALGVWPLLYGLAQWGTMALNPPPPDPIQARIFQLMPILFTFMFAGLAAGLVIYWTWSNLLTMIQQYIIMRRQGVETELDKFIARRLKRAGSPA